MAVHSTTNRLLGGVPRLAYRMTPPSAGPAGLHTDLIPYLTGKPLFVTYKVHYASYVDHIGNMRARMNDLIDAYLATVKLPLIKLHCKWQVGYVVADGVHFTDHESAPRYFAPFKKRIEEILVKTGKSKMILHHPPKKSILFEAGNYTVVDLGLLADGEVCPSQQLR